MGWICKNCSTFNSDTNSQCYVCDTINKTDKICTLTVTKVKKLRLSGHVVVPAEFNVIGEAAFKGRKDIYSITLHKDVKKIGKEAFAGCTNLTKIFYENKLATVSTKAFADCTSLPVSQRVKARYVSDDAYHITPAPKPKPPRETESTSSVRDTSRHEPPRVHTESTHEPPRVHTESTYEPPRVHTESTEYKRKGFFAKLAERYEGCISKLKRLSKIIIFLGVIGGAFIDNFVKEHKPYSHKWYHSIIGLTIFLTCVSAIFAVYVMWQKDKRSLKSVNSLIIPVSLATMFGFILMIVCGNLIYPLNHIYMILLIIFEGIVCYFMEKKKEYSVLPILFLSIVETFILEIITFTK